MKTTKPNRQSTINNRKSVVILFIYCLLFTAHCLLPTAHSFSQGAWTSKASLPVGRGTAVAFTIGSLGYLGTGTAFGYKDDFWQYDPVANTWAQKANVGGGPRAFAIGFSIGNYGYIGMGQAPGPVLVKDFWRYDPIGNTWALMAQYPGAAPGSGAASFAMNGKGYIGDVRTLLDFWEYDPVPNSWTKKSNFPGSPRVDLDRAYFAIGNKGYCGTGGWNSAFLNDLWEYDPATDTWTQKANILGPGRAGAVGFSICNKGFIGLGRDFSAGVTWNDLWMYDPVSNSWSACTAFPAAVRYDLPSFVINNKAYLGTGWPAINDIWEYTPDATICNALNMTTSQTNLPCNGQCTGTATVTPTNGTSPYTYTWSNGQNTQIITGLCAGTYSVLVTDAANNTATSTVTITQPTLLTAAITAANAACGSSNGTANVIAGGGSPSYTYLWNPGGQTTASITGLAAGTYTITVKDAKGCDTTQIVTVTTSGTLSVTVSSTPAGCIADTGTATAISGNGTVPYTYSWNNGQTTQTAVGLAAGNYTVTVTDANGCTQTQTISVTQTPGPNASASASPNTIPIGASTTLTATGGGIYNWSPSTGLSCVTCSNPMAFPSSTIIYCVTVTDSTTGCSDSACVTVLVELDCSNAGELFLPSAFSPNNDGENDKLQIYYGNIECIKTFKLVIYDRWGEKVFETTNISDAWNGKYEGKNMHTEVLVYYLQATTIDGKEIVKKGNISLIK